MKLYLTILICFFYFYNGFAQVSISKEINDQVWLPFIEAFNKRDNIAFSKVHSNDVVRVMIDDQKILSAEEYFKVMPDSILQKWSVWKMNLQLRFLHRISTVTSAFETGYYKNESVNSNTNEKRISYGKFQVLMRKEDGKWKIIMDADSHENVT